MSDHKAWRGLLLLGSALILTGCTQAPPPELQTIENSFVKVAVPKSWVKLGGNWQTPDTLIVYGDVAGSGNHQSLHVFRQSGVYDKATPFDQAFCEQYARFANFRGIYSESSSEISLGNISFRDNSFCEINYTWQPASTNSVQGLDRVYPYGNDLIVVEGTNIEGSDWNTVRQAVESVEIKPF